VRGIVVALLPPALLAARVLAAQSRIEPRPDYAPVAAALERLIAHELADKDVPGLSIALVDDQHVVWAAGFGWARIRDSQPATAETIYRAGSISKVFTALAVMRLVEAGRLDLDTPVTNYLPEFAPVNPFGPPITLRHLLSHHAGLLREPRRGSYYDDGGVSLAATVASLNATSLALAPGSRLKYSNAGLAVAGAAIERVVGQPFADYVRHDLLAALGASHSDFARRPELESRIADGVMWTVDGRRFAAPTFALGVGPAVSLYAPVTDLARTITTLFATAPPVPGSPAGGGGGGTAPRGVLRPETTEQMWTAQFAEPHGRAGMGLGFLVTALDGRRRVWHDGAVYGFSTQLSALPDDRLGVVVAANLDGASAVIDRIAVFALRAMLATRERVPLPTPPINEPVPAATAQRLAGRYVGGPREIVLRHRAGRLFYVPAPGRQPLALRARGDTLVVDDPREAGSRIIVLDTALLAFRDTLFRVPAGRPDSAPSRFQALIGEYGWDHSPLLVYEHAGRLFALLQWFYAYPLLELADTAFALPQFGLFPAERFYFRRGRDGRITAVEVGSVVFPRRRVGPDGGGQLQLRPRRPVPELLREARAATPPADSAPLRPAELVELVTLDPTIKLDIRYATTNNFLGSVFYASARAFLQRPAAEALARAGRRLREQGYGLLVFDGYRPWYVTKVFWDATPQESRWLVADPTRGSRHNRGSAVDLTLYSLATGKTVTMPGTYDEASSRSMPDYPGGTALQRWHRALLRDAMEAEGFSINSEEWWHFDYRDWRAYPILNKSFEDLTQSR
jgi:CubicO group peptidase (beta-lactamase class C family)/D-alanyl-D-alanine dipeptidase